MRVRITNCSAEFYWYKKYIGQEFDVSIGKWNSVECYEAIDPEDSMIGKILIKDCEIIEDTTLKKITIDDYYKPAEDIDIKWNWNNYDIDKKTIDINQGLYKFVEDTEREEVLTKLAEYEYPDECKWVSVDAGVPDLGYTVWWDTEKPIFKGGAWIYGDGYMYPVKLSLISLKPYLYTIDEINQRKEELRMDLKELTATTGRTAEMPAETVQPVIAGETAQNPWFPGRATVQQNIMTMMPDRTRETYKCVPSRYLETQCNCGKEYPSWEQLQRHIKEKTGETMPSTLKREFVKV
jgi:hypothetical protein